MSTTVTATMAPNKKLLWSSSQLHKPSTIEVTDLNPAPPVIQKELADAVLAHVTGSEITQTKGLAAIASMTESNNSLHN